MIITAKLHERVGVNRFYNDYYIAFNDNLFLHSIFFFLSTTYVKIFFSSSHFFEIFVVLFQE